MPNPSDARQRAVRRLASYLQRRGSPRLQMFLLLTLTGLAGFACSVLLHAAGLLTMAVRYPVSVAFAYLVFLSLLALWLASYRNRHGRAGDSAGSSDPWPYYVDPGPGPALPTPAAGKGGGGGWGGLGDGDAALLVIVLIVLAVGAALIASFFVLVEAPVLLAEVLVDGVLMAGLAGKLTRGEPQHWTAGVLRRTWLPALVVAVVFGLVGFGLEKVVPGATTMGEALRLSTPPAAFIADRISSVQGTLESYGGRQEAARAPCSVTIRATRNSGSTTLPGSAARGTTSCASGATPSWRQWR